MRRRIVKLTLLVSVLLQAQKPAPAPQVAVPNPAAATPEAPPLVSCPAGAPIGAVDLKVNNGSESLPFRTINHLGEGDTIRYSAILRGKEKRAGDIALVLVPQTREPGADDVIVTDPKPADKPQEWKISRTISLAAVVYGPAGLSRKKVIGFLSRDEVLVAQLADYAAKTTEAEQLVATLSNQESSAASVNAALNGFASQYGFAVQINRTAAPETQAATVFAAMNPQLATYNPLATSSTAQNAGQTASMATMAATLFFGSPVGLAAGGTAMLLDLRSIAFPDTQFRASFEQPLKDSGVSLCGQQGPAPPHTRVAYIWASRIPNTSTPTIKIGDTDFIPATQKTAVPVEVPEPAWKYLDRARDWALVDAQQNRTPVPVVKLGNQNAIEIDLTKARLAPGEYKLTTLWDWTPIEAAGVVHVLPLSDFKQAHLEAASQDRLLAASGKAVVTLTGDDFEFATKVELKKLNDEFATASSVPFHLPQGLGKGPQDHMDVQLDTGDLAPGAYELLISQQDEKSHPVEFRLLPNPPQISNLPILINEGGGVQHYVLKGQHLELLTKLVAAGAVFNLNPPESGNETERSLTVELNSSPVPGAALPVQAFVPDRSEPLTFANALRITGPLPVIASSKLSLPAGMAIAARQDEFPAGNTLNALLDVKNVQHTSVVRLACADGVGDSVPLQIGRQTGNWNLQQLSPDQLFLAYDTSGLPSGCDLEAVIENGSGGSSQPFTLARILALPKIDSFTVGADPPENNKRHYQIAGTNLEMIAKLGWDEANAVPVASLPLPLPGPGMKQSIAIDLPDPMVPEGKLYVWLRGDQKGRATTIPAPELPIPPPAVVAPPPPPAVVAPAPAGADSVTSAPAVEPAPPAPATPVTDPGPQPHPQQ
jgi:hypothetical protein